eukprot:TRINITY_DN612_c0_g1_i1.p1 TRINITY_DN612_c0_g1~~TRINITY_DN612_c0_g1_i1.p1  ORF type:complete len:1057 (-),score=503.20 TRINITY_DN612_c0_g1_i1:85-3255(-)
MSRIVKDGPATVLTTATTEGSVHSYSKEEKSSIVEHINASLEEDPQLKHLIPIDPETEEIFDVVRDGVLLCKFINYVVPGTIPPSKINIKKNLNRFEVNENLDNALRFSNQIGIKVVNMGAEDFTERKVTLILGLLWQLVRLDLLSKVGNIASRGNLEFLDEDEDLIPEDILLKWVNYHLGLAGHPRKCNNFSSDIKDSENYIVLLNQLAPKTVSLNLLKEKTLLERARLFLESCDKINCKKFINPTDIVKGDSRLNTAFVANLFTVFNKPVAAEPEPEPEPIYVPRISVANDDEMQISDMEKEIERLQKELAMTEADTLQKEEVLKEATASLENRAVQLKSELDAERAKTAKLKAVQDSEIDKLRDKLKNLQVENVSAETEHEIRRRIEQEEEERGRIVANQRKLEEEMDALKDELEEKEEIRHQLEQKRKRVEEETRKLQIKHKSQLDGLKRRILKAKDDEEALEVEFVRTTKIREEAEDTVFELRKDEVRVTKQLNEEISDRERIERTKKRLAQELNKAKDALQTEEELQAVEIKTKTKMSAKLQRYTKQNEELKFIKADLQLQKRMLEETTEELKDELQDELNEKTVATRIFKQLNDEVSELQEELENVEDSKLDDVRRVKAAQKFSIEKLKRDLATDKRKALQPKMRLEEESMEVQMQIMETENQREVVLLAKERLESESKDLSKRLIEETTLKIEIKEEKKQVERDLGKTSTNIEKEKKLKRDQERAKHKLVLENKKLREKAFAEKDAQLELEKDAEVAKKEADEAKELLERESDAKKELANASKNLSRDVAMMSQELAETEAEREKMEKNLAKKLQDEKEKTAKALARSKEKAERDRKNAEKSLTELESNLEREKKEKENLESEKARMEKDQKSLERKMEAIQNEKSEAENTKKKLEKELERARSYMKDEKKVKSSKDRDSKKAEKQLLKAASENQKYESEKADILNAKRALEAKMEEAKNQLASVDKKDIGQSKRDLEAKLADLTAEFDLDHKKTKTKVKQKAEAKKEETKKKLEREKLKPEREAKKLADKEKELLKKLEEMEQGSDS